MKIACPLLLKQKAIAHGFFTRRGGKSSGLYESLNCGLGSGDDIPTVNENRAIVAQALGQKPESLCTAYQIHSPNCVTLSEAWQPSSAPQADALATATPGIVLGILTADCVPVLFADSKQRVIGAAHAGWKGAIGGVLEATIESMLDLGAARLDIVASIGPAIAQKSYEVSEEFRQNFIKEAPVNKEFFIPSAKPTHWMFDLPGYVKRRLEKCGITHVNLLAQDTCFEETDFFSFRRATLRGEPVYGRQISAICLEE